MRTILSIIMWLYFLPGLILGAVLFGMRALESAMGAPEPMVMAKAVGAAALEGMMRALYWVPSMYENVVLNGVPPLSWILSS
jgi:hypothetical protein